MCGALQYQYSSLSIALSTDSATYGQWQVISFSIIIGHKWVLHTSMSVIGWSLLYIVRERLPPPHDFEHSVHSDHGSAGCWQLSRSYPAGARLWRDFLKHDLTHLNPFSVPDGLGVRIPDSHSGGPGSIPGQGEFLLCTFCCTVINCTNSLCRFLDGDKFHRNERVRSFYLFRCVTNTGLRQGDVKYVSIMTVSPHIYWSIWPQ